MVAYQGARGIAGQLRVGIQGDDVLDRAEDGLIADNIREGSLRASLAARH